MFAAQSDLVKRARGKALAPDEYNSGNFTISNLGMFGAESFDAILPPGGERSTSFCDFTPLKTPPFNNEPG